MTRESLLMIVEAAGERARQRREVMCAAGMARVFRRQAKALPIATIANRVARQYGNEADTDIIHDGEWPDEEDAIAALLLAIALRTATDAGSVALGQMGIPGRFAPGTAYTATLADDARMVAARIEQTSRERIAAVLTSNAASGSAAPDLANLTRTEFRNWANRTKPGYFSRSQSIARNEITTAWNRAMHETMARNGWATRLWLTQGDDRVDAGGIGGPCVENELAGPVPIEQEFPSGHLSPPSHVGCRCTLAAGEPGARPDEPWLGGDGGLEYEMPGREL